MVLFFLIFAISIALLQFYYLFFFLKFALSKPKSLDNDLVKPLSVVICGKNASKDLKENLPKIMTQNHPNFEVVVVDDHSVDDTEQILASLANRFPRIKVVSKTSVPDRPGKKAALYTGVSAASHDLVVVTDADCYPASRDWLRYMSNKFEPGVDLVLGISPNEKELGFWKGLFRYETLLTAMLYVSFALRGLPYMGVGRNMAFRKAHFLKNFVQILEGDLASGDDDLYVNFSAKKESTAVCLHTNAYTFSPSPSTFKKWFRQKQRHLTAGFHYQWYHKLLLVLFPAAQLITFIAFLFFLTTPLKWLVLLIISFQFVLQQVVHALILNKMKQNDLALEFPLYQLMWVFILPILSIASTLKSKKQWN